MLWSQGFGPSAADQARHRRRRASTSGAGWSSPHVGHKDHHATTPSPPARACAPWTVNRFSTRQSARGPRATGFGGCGRDVPKPQPPTWRGVGEEASVHSVGWSAWRVFCNDNYPKSASVRVLHGQSASSLRGEARAGRAARGPKAVATRLRNRRRCPGAVSVKNNLRQRRGVERVACWPRRQPRQVRHSARAPWAVGRFSTERSARGPHGTGFECCGHDASKPQPPT